MTTISGAAVVAPGGVTMQMLIDQVQIDLGDVAETTWSEMDLLQWLNDAIRDYSLRWPRTRRVTIAAVSGVHIYDLPDDFLCMVSVAYPGGGERPLYLGQRCYMDAEFWQVDDFYDVVWRHDQDAADELWIGATPEGGESLTVEYLAYHPHNLAAGDNCSVPVEHHHLLRTYAAWRALLWVMILEQQDPTDGSHLLLGQFADNVNEMRMTYLEMVGSAGQRE